MANKLFLQIIAERMHVLTKSEQKTATYVLKNPLRVS